MDLSATPPAVSSVPAADALLPGLSWTEDATLRNPRTGGQLRRWGRVEEACAILAGCDRETLYVLIASGQIRGYKLNPQKRNSPYKVDLLSAWRHKQEQMG